jgi:copper(I)-binding protein
MFPFDRIVPMTTVFARLFALLFLSLSPAFAHDYRIGDLKIDQPWARATPPGARVAGGYMAITNTGSQPDRLIGGTVLAAKIFELHEMRMEGTTMRMRALEKGLEIRPGARVELKPGGFHVMFLDLQTPLKEGDVVRGTLVFERAGTIEVEYKIESRGAQSGQERGGHRH